jgi:hypothetical protein
MDQPDLMWRACNVAAFGLNTLVTYTVGTGSFGKLIGAKSNREISEEHRVLVTPAGWAFAIWGPIFLLEGVAVYRQFVGAAEWRDRTSQAWCAACVLQSAWTFAFSYEYFGTSTLLISGIAASVGVAYASMPASFNLTELLFDGVFAFGLHAAWLVAATVINTNIAAEASDAASPSALVSLAIASELLAAGATAALTLAYRDPTFAAVGSWALNAIRSKLEAERSPPEGFAQSDVVRVAGIARATSAALLAVGGAVFCWRAAEELRVVK